MVFRGPGPVESFRTARARDRRDTGPRVGPAAHGECAATGGHGPARSHRAAKGALMHQMGCCAEEAFAELVRRSQGFTSRFTTSQSHSWQSCPPLTEPAVLSPGRDRFQAWRHRRRPLASCAVLACSSDGRGHGRCNGGCRRRSGQVRATTRLVKAACSAHPDRPGPRTGPRTLASVCVL
jgi:hypothetical protein